ncbi:MAG: ferritin-like domain-containing protein [Actinomycetes bacterium]
MKQRTATTDVPRSLQQVLATEHAAVYGYGLVGGHLSSAELDSASAALAAHENRRDNVLRLLADLGGIAVPALPAYRPRRPVVDRRSAVELATAVEENCAAAYIRVLGLTDDAALRRTATSWLADASVRDALWRARLGARALASNPPLPGLVTPVQPEVTPSAR